MAPGASELILPIALAVTKGLTAADLRFNIAKLVPGTPGATLVDALETVAYRGDLHRRRERLEVEGREGHVAYPHLADNPLPRQYLPAP